MSMVANGAAAIYDRFETLNGTIVTVEGDTAPEMSAAGCFLIRIFRGGR